jgi:hypothetical protein
VYEVGALAQFPLEMRGSTFRTYPDGRTERKTESYTSDKLMFGVGHVVGIQLRESWITAGCTYPSGNWRHSRALDGPVYNWFDEIEAGQTFEGGTGTIGRTVGISVNAETGEFTYRETMTNKSQGTWGSSSSFFSGSKSGVIPIRKLSGTARPDDTAETIARRYTAICPGGFR